MEKNDRIEKLLAMQLINSLAGRNIAEKAAQLSIVGFTNVEIANLLETKSGTINQLLYARRKKQKSKGKK